MKISCTKNPRHSNRMTTVPDSGHYNVTLVEIALIYFISKSTKMSPYFLIRYTDFMTLNEKYIINKIMEATYALRFLFAQFFNNFYIEYKCFLGMPICDEQNTLFKYVKVCRFNFI